jgi:hypothetical protein
MALSGQKHGLRSMVCQLRFRDTLNRWHWYYLSNSPCRLKYPNLNSELSIEPQSKPRSHPWRACLGSTWFIDIGSGGIAFEKYLAWLVGVINESGALSNSQANPSQVYPIR